MKELILTILLMCGFSVKAQDTVRSLDKPVVFLIYPQSEYAYGVGEDKNIYQLYHPGTDNEYMLKISSQSSKLVKAFYKKFEAMRKAYKPTDSHKKVLAGTKEHNFMLIQYRKGKEKENFYYDNGESETLEQLQTQMSAMW